MSDISKSTNSDESEQYSKIIPELDSTLKENLLKIPGATEYIEKLQRTLKKLVKKIRKFKNKIAVSLVNTLKCLIFYFIFIYVKFIILFICFVNVRPYVPTIQY